MHSVVRAPRIHGSGRWEEKEKGREGCGEEGKTGREGKEKEKGKEEGKKMRKL